MMSTLKHLSHDEIIKVKIHWKYDPCLSTEPLTYCFTISFCWKITPFTSTRLLRKNHMTSYKTNVIIKHVNNPCCVLNH